MNGPENAPGFHDVATLLLVASAHYLPLPGSIHRWLDGWLVLPQSCVLSLKSSNLGFGLILMGFD